MTRLTEQNRRNSAKDLEQIQSMHDAACYLGAKCGARQMEASRRNSKGDMGRIQEAHDIAAKLGATCDDKNMPGVTEAVIDRGKARRVLAYLGAE